MRVTVRVSPGSRRDEVGGRYGEGDPPVLRVRVGARAVDGRANDAVRAVVADALGVAPGAVRIVSGQRSRRKILDVTGADPARVEELLRRPPA